MSDVDGSDTIPDGDPYADPSLGDPAPDPYAEAEAEIQAEEDAAAQAALADESASIAAAQAQSAAEAASAQELVATEYVPTSVPAYMPPAPSMSNVLDGLDPTGQGDPISALLASILSYASGFGVGPNEMPLADMALLAQLAAGLSSTEDAPGEGGAWSNLLRDSGGVQLASAAAARVAPDNAPSDGTQQAEIVVPPADPGAARDAPTDGPPLDDPVDQPGGEGAHRPPGGQPLAREGEGDGPRTLTPIDVPSPPQAPPPTRQPPPGPQLPPDDGGSPPGVSPPGTYAGAPVPPLGVQVNPNPPTSQTSVPKSASWDARFWAAFGQDQASQYLVQLSTPPPLAGAAALFGAISSLPMLWRNIEAANAAQAMQARQTTVAQRARGAQGGVLAEALFDTYLRPGIDEIITGASNPNPEVAGRAASQGTSALMQLAFSIGLGLSNGPIRAPAAEGIEIKGPSEGLAGQAGTGGPELFSRGGARTNVDVLQNGGGLSRTPETVASYAADAEIELANPDVHIVDELDECLYLDWQGACACASPLEGGGAQIRLGPASFADEETLVRTLAHENTHVLQYMSEEVSTGALQSLEDAAYASEEPVWTRYAAKKAP